MSSFSSFIFPPFDGIKNRMRTHKICMAHSAALKLWGLTISRRAAVSSSLWLDADAIDFPTMSNPYNANNNFLVRYRIDNSVLPLANTIFVMPRQFFGAWWTWIFGKCLDPIDNAETVFLGECLDFLGSRRFDENVIACHVSADP